MKELSAELRKAQEYENKALKEENENKFPVFHLKVPTGWMNDPNGFSVYKGVLKCGRKQNGSLTLFGQVRHAIFQKIKTIWVIC